MVKLKAGEAVPSVAEAAERSWWAFRHFNEGSATDPHISFVMGYRRAAADMLVDLFQFGQWDLITRRMLEVFEELAIEREAVRIVVADDDDGQE
jgi:hypothetical protein